MFAAAQGNVAIAKLLLENKADVHANAAERLRKEGEDVQNEADVRANAAEPLRKEGEDVRANAEFRATAKATGLRNIVLVLVRVFVGMFL